MTNKTYTRQISKIKRKNTDIHGYITVPKSVLDIWMDNNYTYCEIEYIKNTKQVMVTPK